VLCVLACIHLLYFIFGEASSVVLGVWILWRLSTLVYPLCSYLERMSHCIYALFMA
jgi:hypothetical protein